jgi:DNA-binding FadR family transcriptional regulator
LEAKIVDLIKANNLRVGEKLPPERELARILGVSRPSLRNAINALVMAGVLYVKQGSGTYIAQQTLNHVLDIAQSTIGYEPWSIVEARLALEPSIAELAARKATPDDIQHIQMALEVIENDYATLGTFTLEHDRDFHNAITLAAHNPPLFHAVRYLYSFDMSDTWVEVRNSLFSNSIFAKEMLDDHREIFNAIAKRKPRLAKEILSKHTAKMFSKLSDI